MLEFIFSFPFHSSLNPHKLSSELFIHCDVDIGGQGFCGPGPGPTWVGWEDRMGCRVGLGSVRDRAKGQWGEGSEEGKATPQSPPVFELPLAFMFSMDISLNKVLRSNCTKWFIISLKDHLEKNFRKCFIPKPALYLCF